MSQNTSSSQPQLQTPAEAKSQNRRLSRTPKTKSRRDSTRADSDIPADALASQDVNSETTPHMRSSSRSQRENGLSAPKESRLSRKSSSAPSSTGKTPKPKRDQSRAITLTAADIKREIEKQEQALANGEDSLLSGVYPQPVRGKSNPSKSENGRRRAGSDPTAPQQLKPIKPQVPSTTQDTPENQLLIIQIQKYIRQHNAQKKTEIRATLQIERTHIAKEILSTEETYHAILSDLVKEWLDPIKAKVWTQHAIISNELMHGLFPDGLRDILRLSEQFLADVKSALGTWSPSTSISPIFLKLYRNLSEYAPYVQSFPIIQISLQKAKEDHSFMAFLTQRFQQPDFQRLSSMLITPIQRIPRYRLLLESLIKVTWKEHADYAQLGEAAQKMEQAALYVNESSREADKIIQISDSLIGLKTSIVIAKRKFVREGDLQQWIKGEWKRRRFFLFNDIIIRSRVLSSFPYQRTNYIRVHIRHLTVGTDIPQNVQSEINDTAKCKMAFWIKHPEAIDWLVLAPTQELKFSWMYQIKQTVSNFTEAEKRLEETRVKNAQAKAYLVRSQLASKYGSMNRSVTEPSPGTKNGETSPTSSDSVSNKRAYTANRPTLYSQRISITASEAEVKDDGIEALKQREAEELEHQKLEDQAAMQAFLDLRLANSRRTAYREGKGQVSKDQKSFGKGPANSATK